MSASRESLQAWPPAQQGATQAIRHAAWEEARNAVLDLASKGPVTVALVGGAGTGKTWLLRELAGSLGDHGFPSTMLMQGDLSATVGEGGALLIDESLRMSDEVLDELLQQQHAVVVLTDVERFGDRVAGRIEEPVIINLRPLEPDEVAEFSAEWLRRAGLSPSILDPGSLSRVVLHGRGSVRLVTRLLGAAVALRASSGKATVSAGDLDRLANFRLRGLELPPEPAPPVPAAELEPIAASAPEPAPRRARMPRRPSRAAMAGVAVAACAALVWGLRPAPSEPLPAPSPTERPAPGLAAVAPPTETRIAQALPPLAPLAPLEPPTPRPALEPSAPPVAPPPPLRTAQELPPVIVAEPNAPRPAALADSLPVAPTSVARTAPSLPPLNPAELPTPSLAASSGPPAVVVADAAPAAPITPPRPIETEAPLVVASLDPAPSTRSDVAPAADLPAPLAAPAPPRIANAPTIGIERAAAPPRFAAIPSAPLERPLAVLAPPATPVMAPVLASVAPPMPPIRPRRTTGAPGMVLIAQRGETLRSMYEEIYRDRPRPPFADVLAANPSPYRPGALVIFPEPPGGWSAAQR